METTRSARILRIARNIAGRKSDGAEEGAEGGFTLIELMVVLLIMAILLAIAIPTFLGVKGSAQNRAAQSDLTNAITSAKAVYTNAGSYGSVSGSLVTTLSTAEPELHFTTGSVTSGQPHTLSVAVSTDGLIVILAEQSANGTCWFAEDNDEPGGSTTTGGQANAYTGGQGVSYASIDGAASCTANTNSPSNWGASYPAS